MSETTRLYGLDEFSEYCLDNSDNIMTVQWDQEKMKYIGKPISKAKDICWEILRLWMTQHRFRPALNPYNDRASFPIKWW